MKINILHRSLSLFALSALAMVSLAQQPVSATGTGTVTGHVTLGDTRRPARFATVALYGVPAEVTATPKPDPDASDEAKVKAMAAALKNLGKTNMVQAQTGADGAYVATDVAPGDYYVFGSASGYVSPLNQVQAIFEAGADLKKPLPGVQIVHVAADHQSTANVTIERGAAISGVISWDDGSPVTGAIFTVTPAKGDAKPPSQFGMLVMTSMLSALSISDDLGHYRISGLAPGDYIVTATLRTGGQSGLGAGTNLAKMMAVTPMVVYAPSAFHKADAKPVTLTAGEDLRDQAMTLNLAGLHSVSGTIASAEDHHGINQATVQLQDGADREFVRSASVDAAGNFTVTFLPPGTYTMKVSGGEDTEPKPKTDKDKANIFGQGQKTIRSYKDGSMSVIVSDSDVTGENIELAVDKNPKTQADFSKMFDDDDKPPAK
jgi:Carboxypeptidase regulatory-like domain